MLASRAALQRAAFLVAAVTVAVATLGAPASAAVTNYGQYSLLGQRQAGQFWADGSAAGQWAWAPNGPSSDIAWGDPAHWPPPGGEHFVRSGSWLLLDGWSDNGTYYTQRVTSEQLGDGACRRLLAIPSDGARQHYVQWSTPSSSYCLIAVGTITEQTTGAVVNFVHTQVWSPPSGCRNQYFGSRSCITQHETWTDNNGNPGGPLVKKLDRTMRLAYGLGPAFTIDQAYPAPWHAALRYVWGW